MNYQTLLDRIKELPVIDTHEHFMTEEDVLKGSIDFFDMLVPYICDQLINSGMSRDQWAMLCNKSLSLEQRWEVFSEYFKNIRYTTYFQAMFRTLHRCFGMQDVTLDEVVKVSTLLKNSNIPGVYKRIKDKNNIEKILTFIPFDMVENFNKSDLIAIPTVSDICIRSCFDIDRIESVSGINISRFDELLDAIDIVFEIYAKNNVKAIKFGSAYRRKLDYEYVLSSQAEEVFRNVITARVNGDTRMCGSPTQVLGEDDVKALDDYLTDYMISIAGQKEMSVFFHGGIHAWNENQIEAAKVSYMEGLIRRHKNVNFIILHCGMPFIDESVLLCRYYSNVYLNLTWSHIIDKTQTRLLIRKFVEALPINKVHGFGGDYVYPQQIYGHLQIAYENIASALYSFIEEGIMNEDQALQIARQWLYENPKALLKI